MASNVGGQAAKRLRKIASEVKGAEKTAVRGSAMGAKKVMQSSLSAAVPSGRLRGVGKSGARVGVRFDMKGDDALVRATGPWHLIENPSKPHEIRPKGRGARRNRAVLTPQGPRAVVRHPGVRNPKRPWKKGRPEAVAVVVRTMHRSYEDAWRRGLR